MYLCFYSLQKHSPENACSCSKIRCPCASFGTLGELWQTMMQERRCICGCSFTGVTAVNVIKETQLSHFFRMKKGICISKVFFFFCVCLLGWVDSQFSLRLWSRYFTTVFLFVIPKCLSCFSNFPSM